MKVNKAFIFMGMIGTATFVLQDVLGSLLWKAYNPVSMYISYLTADGAPHLLMTRSLYTAYSIFLILFFVGMCYLAFRRWHSCLKIGYSVLLIVLFLSFIGIGSFPMTMENVFAAQNTLHLIVTVGMLVLTALMLYLLAIGYLKQEGLVKIGYLSLTAAILFTVFNLLHLLVIVAGLDITGLVQRFSFYTFFIYLFLLSFYFVRKREDAAN